MKKLMHDRFESVHRKKDGSIFYVEISSSIMIIKDETNFVSFIRDISDRKEKEKLIENQKTRLLNIIEGTNAGTWEWNLQTGDLFINERWANIIGYELAELEPVSIETWIGLVHPDDLQISDNLIRRHIKKELDYYQIECRMKHKNGSWIWVFDRGKVVEWTNDGQPLWMYGTHMDITDRKASEFQLRDSEARFKALHNASFGGIVIHDKGKILECNAGLSKISGFSYEELIGSDGLLLISEETRDIVINYINAGYEKTYEVEGVRKDGSKYPLRLEARNIPYKGKNVRVVEFRDISEIKEIEAAQKKLEFQLQQSQKLEAIGTLTGGIAHDFNNLLTPIMGFADMMRYKMATTDPYYEFVKEILNSSIQAKELIQQLLTFSRKYKDEVGPLNLIPVIKSSVKLIRSSLPVSININLDLPSEVNNILANNTQIHQIIMNLCINASHALVREDGQARGIVNIKLKEVNIDKLSQKQFVNLSPGKYIQITISDNGKGMDDQLLSHIFEPFFTTKEEGKGTGMGLAVVHGIVSSYNGEIKVYSQPNKGTTFNIYFPTTEKDIINQQNIMTSILKKRDERNLYNR